MGKYEFEVSLKLFKRQFEEVRVIGHEHFFESSIKHAAIPLSAFFDNVIQREQVHFLSQRGFVNC